MRRGKAQSNRARTAGWTAALILGCAVLSCPVSALATEPGLDPLIAGAGSLLDPRTPQADPTALPQYSLKAADVSGNTPAKSSSLFEAIPAATQTLVARAADTEKDKSAVSGQETTDDGQEVSAPAVEEETPAPEPAEKPAPEPEEESSTLVMADVNQTLNVRVEPDPSAEKIGVLYKDCGGTILERRNGWTKLQSGDLVGWASDDYLLFGKQAEALAADVGNLIARIGTDSLRVRKEASKDSGIYGLVKTGETYEVVKRDDGSGFVCIDYKGKEGYVSSDFVKVDFKIDTGETLEAINKREKAEAEKKAKLVVNQGAVAANTDEVKLLAALIQCEAGNQPYEGKLGVAAVVMNRVRSGAYPNSIYSVIYASGQFGPAATGQVASAYVGEIAIGQSCYTAAQAAINGETTVGGACHFRRVGSHEGVVIGNHVFW